jgi:hypothetical protein
MGAIITNKNGKLLAAGGMHDHIQLYASLPSTITLANFVILESRTPLDRFMKRDLRGKKDIEHSASANPGSQR